MSPSTRLEVEGAGPNGAIACTVTSVESGTTFGQIIANNILVALGLKKFHLYIGQCREGATYKVAADRAFAT